MNLPDGSRVRREPHARFCERLGVQFPRPTHPTVPVLAKLKTVTGRIWTYVRDDRPFGGKDPPAALFYYSRTRAGEYPRAHLAGWTGIMQADAFAGFNEPTKAGESQLPLSRRRVGPTGGENFSIWRN